MDHTSDHLAQFDGEIFEYGNGFWYKIDWQPGETTPERPSGSKYSIAFFNEDDECLVRFDNAHPVRVHGRPGPVAWDHWHRFSNGTLVPYEFKDAETLLDDFFAAVEMVLKSS